MLMEGVMSTNKFFWKGLASAALEPSQRYTEIHRDVERDTQSFISGIRDPLPALKNNFSLASEEHWEAPFGF